MSCESTEDLRVKVKCGGIWWTELRAQVSRPIWGDFRDTMLNAFVRTLPDGFSPTGDCLIAVVPGEPPPPQVGDAAVFLLMSSRGRGPAGLGEVPSRPHGRVQHRDIPKLLDTAVERKAEDGRETLRMRPIREVVRLTLDRGLSHREIAPVLRIS